MAALPPHQAILAGFVIGLIGAAYGVVAHGGCRPGRGLQDGRPWRALAGVNKRVPETSIS